MDKEYTEKQWGEEMKISSFCGGQHWQAGSCTISCPKCGTVGFYGPRKDKEGRKYRLCKFCGFGQEVWIGANTKNEGKPYRCRHVYCEKCRTIDTYNWHLPWAGLDHCLRGCGAEEKETNWASDNLNHPFHKIKEQMDRMHQNSQNH